MTSSDFPRGFDPTRSVLFLGSGFSIEATNCINEHLPAGDDLRKKILKSLNDPDSDADLKDVAFYAVQSGLNLSRLLADTFTVKSLSADQEEIAGKKWRRIYTTNYDDAIEFYHKKNKAQASPKSFSYEDARPTKIRPQSIVHLHGYIHNCTKENILNQLILDHRSYAEQAVKETPWWEQFERDIRGATHIFFVGYSLSDFVPASYLTKSPELANKVHFVVRGPVADYTRSRLGGYGSIHEISVSGFAEECRLSKVGASLSGIYQLQSFKVIDPNKDNKAPQRPTPVQIESLLTLGYFDFQKLASTYPEPVYALPRRTKMRECLEKLDVARSVIIHSRIANGKSIFCSMLAVELASKGYTCLEYRSHTSINEQELDLLAGFRKLCVFFENYDDLVNSRDEIAHLGDDCKFIVQMNTGTDQVRRSEVQSSVPKPIERIDLNQMEGVDQDDFIHLLNDAGLPPNTITFDIGERTEFRDLLLRLIESPHVVDRLTASLKSVSEDRKLFPVLLTTCILKAFGIPADPGFIRAVAKEDPYDVLYSSREAASELLTFDIDRLEPHSAVFSEFFVKSFARPSDIIGAIYWMCAEAAARINSDDNSSSQRMREARRALGGLMQYGNTSRLFPKNLSSQKFLTDLYEALRKNDDIKREPLFWLQYSIFMQDIPDYPLAEKHMRTAYARASEIEGFLTYQLDTNYLGLLLKGDGITRDADSCMENILRLTERARTMIGEENHRIHSFKVLEMFESFLKRNINLLDSSFQQKLAILLLGVAQDLDKFPLTDKLEFGSDITKKSVQAAISVMSRNLN